MNTHASVAPLQISYTARMWKHALFVALCLSASACDDSEKSEHQTRVSEDPRCQALCTDAPPTVEGAYDMCSIESLDQCGELCEVRIEDTQNLCAECLLEGAFLDSPSAEEPELCVDGTCYVGLSRSCDNGCWRDESGIHCVGGTSCEGAIDGYEAEVADGDACKYPDGNEEMRAACHVQLHPREEVSCDVQFEGVTRCADVCAG